MYVFYLASFLIGPCLIAPHRIFRISSSCLSLVLASTSNLHRMRLRGNTLVSIVHFGVHIFVGRTVTLRLSMQQLGLSTHAVCGICMQCVGTNVSSASSAAFSAAANVAGRSSTTRDVAAACGAASFSSLSRSSHLRSRLLPGLPVRRWQPQMLPQTFL